MTIPPQVDALLPGLLGIMGEFAAQYRRSLGARAALAGLAIDEFPNWEAGMFPIDLLVPGLSVAVERYNQGGNTPGWLLRVHFTDGTSTSEKVIDAGPAGFSQDWTPITP